MTGKPVQSESDFMAMVIKLARDHGWLVAHFRAAQDRKGRWLTPVQADGAGFPDLILVRGRKCLAIELKSDKGKVSPEQSAWIDALNAAGIPAAVARPKDWDAIVRELTRPL